MFMKGVLRAKGSAADQARRVFVADSFKGFPLAAEEDKRVDSDGWFHENSAFNVDGGGAEVRSTFKRYGLWDEQVTILAGYFNDSLPYAATNGYLDGGLALIRMDCDMYRSTMDVLDTLWPYLSKGGIVAHNNFEYTAPRTAVVEFRRKHGLQRLPIHIVDDNAMFFVKE